jgi:hypothetical protein
MKPEGTLLFEEEQHLDPRTAIVIPLILTVIAAAAPLVVYHFVIPEEAKSEARVITMLVSLGTLVVGIPMVVLPGWLVRVITEVRTGGVFVRQWPMPFRRVDLGNGSSIRIAAFNAWRYYDAKDILKLIRGRKLCMAADVKGRGVLIERTDGTSMLIGSRAPERLLHAIESIAGRGESPAGRRG